MVNVWLIGTILWSIPVFLVGYFIGEFETLERISHDKWWNERKQSWSELMAELEK